MPRPDDPLDLQPPGGYLLRQRIGRGTFGEVWRAEAPGGIEVAVKIIHRTLDKPELAERELAALQLMKRLRHQGLLTVQAYFPLPERLWIVMELADRAMDERLEDCRREGRDGIPTTELLGYFAEAAEALDYLHDNQVQHRDIKPANLLLLGRHAKVADFGLARLLDEESLQTATTIGSPAFMAPEIWTGHLSRNSDQYSLAVTYIQLHSGRLLFPARGVAQWMHHHLNERPDLGAFTEPVQEVLGQALAKKPRDRYRSCSAFVSALAEAARKQASSPAGSPAARATESVTTDPWETADPVREAPQASGAHAPGVKFSNSLIMELMPIAAGEFLMGADKEVDDQAYDDESPRHRVHVPGGFAIGVHKVRQADFQKVLQRNPSHFSTSGDHPVETVTFFDAIEFCIELAKLENLRPCYRLTDGDRDRHGSITAAQVELLEDGTGYRLPTEAEWEYCAGAGKSDQYTKYCFGDDAARLGEYAWYSSNSGGRTHPVGQKKHNAWGLLDMGGLLWEWIEDVWHPNYQGAPQDGKAWLDGGEQRQRVLRGGSWFLDARGCRCAIRLGVEPGDRIYVVGFRVVLVSPQD